MQIARPAQQPREASLHRGQVVLLVLGLVVTVAAIVGAGVLWARYGTAVFFEMIASGIAACF